MSDISDERLREEMAIALQKRENEKRRAGYAGATWPDTCTQSKAVYLYEARCILTLLPVIKDSLTTAGPVMPETPSDAALNALRPWTDGDDGDMDAQNLWVTLRDALNAEHADPR